MQCRDLTSAWANANATSCDPGTSGGLTTSCRQVPYDGPTAVDSCTPGTSSDGVTTTCQTNTSGPTPVQSCTADSPDSSNHWTTTTCTGTSNTLADVAEYYYKTDLRDSSLSPTSCDGALVGTDVCQNNVPTVGRDSASWQHMTTFTLGLGARGRMVFSPTYLTDVSGDYYSVKNGVPYNPSTPSICSWQTSGACNWPTPDVLGTPENIDDVWHAAVNGRGTYFSATDPASLATGLSSTLNSLKTITGSSAAATTSNPNVAMGDNYVFSSFFTTVDWTGELIRQQIDTTTGVLPIYNETDTATYDWSARDRLDANTSRTIYTYNTSTHSLQAFTSANFASSPYFNTPNIASLTQFCTNGAATCLDSVSQASPSQADAAGANLVNYLRGDRSHEGTVNDPGTPTAYYRQRTHILGDIVDSEAVYVRGSLNQYADAGYSLFVTANATRQPMVYVGANDGMLHAFYAADGSSGIVGGNEAWGYIPSLVLPNLYKLADENYTNHHQFYVDSTPTVSDICVSQCSEAANAVWKTILVGGLNAGGRGYYALDITNPSSPNVLWEFTDSNLGYTYGNPIITKLNDGTWVVLVASGYNNVVPGDGQGRLYVLNATTGAIIHQMSNGVGDATTPSGLARINAWVNNAAVDNTSLRVYGGDLQGNLWRFDLNATTGSYDAQLLVTLKDAAGNAQPITAKPELGKVSGTAVVYVGTGKFLGTTDLVNTSQQSFYAVKDTLAIQGTAILGNPHNFTCSTTGTTSCFVQQTVTNATCPSGSSACSSGQAVRTSTNNVMDFGTNSGWYVDLANNGERTNTDPTLALGSLVFTANTPSVSSCTVGGYSYIYILNYLTGAAGIATANTTSGATTASNAVAAVMLGNVFATRSTVVELPNYTLVGITRLSNGTTVTTNIPPLDSSGPLRRISWHELF